MQDRKGDGPDGDLLKIIDVETMDIPFKFFNIIYPRGIIFDINNNKSQTKHAKEYSQYRQQF